MSDEAGRTFQFPQLGPVEQQLSAAIVAGLLAKVLQLYRDTNGVAAYESVKEQIMLNVKNNEIGGFGMAEGQAITTHVLTVLDFAFDTADRPTPR